MSGDALLQLLVCAEPGTLREHGTMNIRERVLAGFTYDELLSIENPLDH
jgi:hypothetical protein